MAPPHVTAFRVTDVHAVRYRTTFAAETALLHARRARHEGRLVMAEVWGQRAVHRAPTHTVTWCAARAGLCTLYLQVGRPRAALAQLEGWPAWCAPAVRHHLAGRAHHAHGDLPRAEPELQQALRHLFGRPAQNPHRARVLLDLAVVWDDAGHEDRAEMGLRTAARACALTGQPRHQAAALLELGLLVFGRAPGEASAHLEQALFLAEQTGDRRLVRDILIALARARRRDGAHRAALRLTLRAASGFDLDGE